MYKSTCVFYSDFLGKINILKNCNFNFNNKNYLLSVRTSTTDGSQFRYVKFQTLNDES